MKLNHLAAALTFLLIVLLEAFENPFDFSPFVESLLTPDWFAIVCFYWAAHQHLRVPPLAMWLIGFLMDVLTSTPFGLHSVTATLAILLGHRLVDSESGQLGLLKLGFLVLLVVLSGTVKSIVFMFVDMPVSYSIFSSLLPVLSSAVAWLILSNLFDSVLKPPPDFY